jgi:Pyruvate/2-oxoacid:ferredoxin oxidoreductase delta subunit
VFRALRRAGLDARGGSGCDPAARRALEPSPGRWAAVGGAAPVLADARAVLDGAAAAGARLVVVADRATGADGAVEAALAAAGARAVRVDPADLAGAEAAARAAAETGGAVLVALSGCVRGAATFAPLAIAPSRCNRCGACLALGCPAISDPGGEAMAIDAGTCTGCGLCAPLCRGRAIRSRRTRRERRRADPIFSSHLRSSPPAPAGGEAG